MKLEGEFKKDFSTWYVNRFKKEYLTDTFYDFTELPFSMKYGVLAEFIDSVGYDIVLYFRNEGYLIQVFKKDEEYAIYSKEYIKDREEASKKVIKVVMKMYNEHIIKVKKDLVDPAIVDNIFTTAIDDFNTAISTELFNIDYIEENDELRDKYIGAIYERLKD